MVKISVVGKFLVNMILQRLIYLDVEFTLIPNRAVVNEVVRSMEFSDGEKQ